MKNTLEMLQDEDFMKISQKQERGIFFYLELITATFMVTVNFNHTLAYHRLQYVLSDT